MRLALQLGVVALVGSGCGRMAFDGVPDEAAPDAQESGAFSPISSSCAEADAGPFALVDTFPSAPTGGGYGVYAAPPNILMADEYGGVNNLHIDGGRFTQVDHLDGGIELPAQIGWVEAVWGDGQHFYIGSPGRGLYVVDVANDGRFVRLGDNQTEMVQARKGWHAGNGLQFVADGDGGVKAVRYAAGAVEVVGANLPMTSWAQGAWALGNRVVLADAGALRVAEFDGSDYTETITPDTAHPGYTRLWIDRDDTIFAVHATGVTAYRIVGGVIRELDTFTTADAGRDVWSDGQHVFVAATTDGTYALSFVDDHFRMIDHADSGGSTLGVFGDGAYVYTNDQNVGLRAWAGFTCRRW